MQIRQQYLYCGGHICYNLDQHCNLTFSMFYLGQVLLDMKPFVGDWHLIALWSHACRSSRPGAGIKSPPSVQEGVKQTWPGIWAGWWQSRTASCTRAQSPYSDCRWISALPPGHGAALVPVRPGAGVSKRRLGMYAGVGAGSQGSAALGLRLGTSPLPSRGTGEVRGAC